MITIQDIRNKYTLLFMFLKKHYTISSTIMLIAFSSKVKEKVLEVEIKIVKNFIKIF